jgi:hypothetical protein
VSIFFGDISLQHCPNRQSTLPFASFCRFGALASLAGAGGGQGPSELEASGDGGGPGTTPELEAPGQGGVDGEADMVGDCGSDMAKCRMSRENAKESPKTPFPYAPGGFSAR